MSFPSFQYSLSFLFSSDEDRLAPGGGGGVYKEPIVRILGTGLRVSAAPAMKKVQYLKASRYTEGARNSPNGSPWRRPSRLTGKAPRAGVVNLWYAPRYYTSA